MRGSIVLLAAVACLALAAAAAHAMYSVANEGRWPKSWPVELEPLRKQARTLAGPTVEALHYQIPFEKREQFEAAWPHLLKVKTKGAPIFLRRSPDASLGITIKAGVVVHTPPENTDRRANPEAPLPGRSDMPGRWMWTNWIELVVDGDVVDLNRIPLPLDTPIIDTRFTAPATKPATQPAGAAGGGAPASPSAPASAAP